jgi:carbon-monoxide dehydrogenase medium subunit
MYTAPFAYRRAESLDEALHLLQEHPEAKLLAGGHSLLPAMKLRLAAPSLLIDIGRLPELRGVRKEGTTLLLGAATLYSEVLASPLAREVPLLAEVISEIGDPMVRHRGTVGGSLAHADPAADLPAAMLALEAKLRIVGLQGRREVSAEDFFQGMFTTALQPGEILEAIAIPLTQGTMAYEKFPHPASRYAIVGVAAVAAPNQLRVAVTGAAERPFRLHALESTLSGGLSREAIERTCHNLVSPEELLGDPSASAEYRAHLIDVLTQRALLRLLG